MKRKTCSVDGCQEPAICKGLCQRHYQRLWKYGTTDEMVKIPKPIKKCSVEGCENQAKAQGLCNKHYLRKLRTGSFERITMSNMEEDHAASKTNHKKKAKGQK